MQSLGNYVKYHFIAKSPDDLTAAPYLNDSLDVDANGHIDQDWYIRLVDSGGSPVRWLRQIISTTCGGGGCCLRFNFRTFLRVSDF